MSNLDKFKKLLIVFLEEVQKDATLSLNQLKRKLHEPVCSKCSGKGLYFFFVSILQAAVFLSSCETHNVEKKFTDYEINGCVMEIYVIDSCEYIGRLYGTSSDKLTHKGNCKFCEYRYSCYTSKTHN